MTRQPRRRRRAEASKLRLDNVKKANRKRKGLPIGYNDPKTANRLLGQFTGGLNSGLKKTPFRQSQ